MQSWQIGWSEFAATNIIIKSLLIWSWFVPRRHLLIIAGLAFLRDLAGLLIIGGLLHFLTTIHDCVARLVQATLIGPLAL